MMIQDMMNSENSMNTTESTNTNIFKINYVLDLFDFQLGCFNHGKNFKMILIYLIL